MASTEHEAAHERPLTADDLPHALQLSTEAGGNQTAEDWRYALNAGTGFAVEAGGRLSATAVALPYGSFGWIGMLFVRPDARRRGFGSRLLHRATESLQRAGCVPAIDATPASRTLLKRAGFKDVWKMKRLRRVRPHETVFAPDPGELLRPMDDRDVEAVIRLDQIAFGAPRGALIEHLRRRAPDAALVIEKNGTIEGFLLGRRGRTALHLGPLVTPNERDARAMIVRALDAERDEIVIDVPDEHIPFRDWLAGAGCVAERPMTRMLFERFERFDRGDLTFAVAGPELG